MHNEYTIGDSTILVCKCEREGCDHVWIAADLFTPARCAKCKSPNWEKRVSAKKQFEKATPRVIAQAVEPEKKPEVPLKGRYEKWLEESGRK